MEVVTSSWASMQAVSAAKFWLLANRDNLLLYAEPLDQLMEPLHRHAQPTSFPDLVGFWTATLVGLAMGGIAAWAKAAVNKALQ